MGYISQNNSLQNLATIIVWSIKDRRIAIVSTQNIGNAIMARRVNGKILISFKLWKLFGNIINSYCNNRSIRIETLF